MIVETMLLSILPSYSEKMGPPLTGKKIFSRVGTEQVAN